MLKHGRYCCCCCLCCWWYCFVAKKQALLCLNISLGRNPRILDDCPEYACTMSHQQTDKPASDIWKPLTTHKVVQDLICSQETQRPQSRAPHLSRGTRHVCKRQNQTRSSVSVGVGWQMVQHVPFSQTAPVHMGIWIPRNQDGAARNRVLEGSWAKVPREQGERGVMQKPEGRSRTAGESKPRVEAEAEEEPIASTAGEARWLRKTTFKVSSLVLPAFMHVR